LKLSVLTQLAEKTVKKMGDVVESSDFELLEARFYQDLETQGNDLEVKEARKSLLDALSDFGKYLAEKPPENESLNKWKTGAAELKGKLGERWNTLKKVYKTRKRGQSVTSSVSSSASADSDLSELFEDPLIDLGEIERLKPLLPLPLHKPESHDLLEIDNITLAKVSSYKPLGGAVSKSKLKGASLWNPQQEKKVDYHLVRRLVSQNRKRFVDKEAGYDLDLAYITDNIIGMAHPGRGLERFYRNSYSNVIKFLNERHGNHYRIYNLCMKQAYPNISCAVHYGFADHNPCPLSKLFVILNDIDSWLKKSQLNVAAIHCKAGKGRTGVVVSSYLLHSNFCKTAREAMEYYGQQRTVDGFGLTVASQQRYVYYYELALREKALMARIRAPRKLSPRFRISSVTIYPIPSFCKGSLGGLYISISDLLDSGVSHRCRTSNGLFKVVKFKDSDKWPRNGAHWDAFPGKDSLDNARTEDVNTPRSPKSPRVPFPQSPFTSFKQASLSNLVDAIPVVDGPLKVQGDFRIAIHHDGRKINISSKKILHLWANTNFISVSRMCKTVEVTTEAWRVPPLDLKQLGRDNTPCGSLLFAKPDLDGLAGKDHKSKLFPENFQIQINFTADRKQPSYGL